MLHIYLGSRYGNRDLRIRYILLFHLGAASVMAPAVANPLYMGYKALYKTILEDSKRGIAKALRVFTDIDNLPVLIHCIHGLISNLP